MKPETKLLLVVLVLTVVLLVGGVMALSRNLGRISTNSQSRVIYQIDYSKGQKIGSDSAKVKLVEFGDFQCPACAAYEPGVENIRNKTAQGVQVIYRHFPLAKHKNAQAAAEAAEEAAAQGKFWPYHDRLFATQQEWSQLPDPTDYFANLGKDLGLNGDKIKEAIKTSKYKDIIEADIKEGNAIAVNGTPTFYLNGEKMPNFSPSELELGVDKALKQ